MKIAFVYPAFENLGIEYISAVLKQHGHETFLAFDPQLFDDLFLNWPKMAKFFDYRDKVIERLRSERPDVIMFSVVSDIYSWALEIARKIKAELGNIPILFGGPHVTSVPEKVLEKDYVDYVVLGEGEYPTLELIEAIEGNKPKDKILNLGYKEAGVIKINETRPLIQNLDALPFPDVDLFLNQNPYAKKEYNIITGRGCVHACSYCHNSVERNVLWKHRGKYFRRRSMENVLAELKERKKKYNFETVCFWDEVFTCDVDWLEEFCLKYKREISVPFWTFVHPNHISERVVQILEDAGCWEVEMGIQTLNPWVKKSILNRPESKNTVQNAIRHFEKSKIRLVVDVIFGLPLLQEQDYRELINTFNETMPTKIQTFWLRYYPRTDIVKTAKEHHLITDKEIGNIENGVPRRAAASGGSFVDSRLEKFQTTLSVLPYLPKNLRKNLLDRNWIRFMPKVSAYGHLFTRLFDVKNPYDVGARRYKGRMIYFTAKKILPFI